MMFALIGLIIITSGSVVTSVFAVHKGDCPPSNGNETIKCPSPSPPPKCPPGNDTQCGGHGGGTTHKKHHISSGGISDSSSSRHGSLIQLPSNATDFPDNDANVIQVHVATAKKDIIGAYHVTGEITN